MHLKEKVDFTVYLVTDSCCCQSRKLFLEKVEAACQGGVTLVQLREKDVGGREYLERAILVKRITDRYGIPLIIDDRADVALACGAAGVHVGASDLPVAEARKLMGQEKMVGATAKTVEAAKKAWKDGADYLGVGAIYPTDTKVITVRTEIATLQAICETVPIPIVAIGGLKEDNLNVLLGSGVDGIAVVSAIMKAGNPREAAGLLRRRVRQCLAG